MQQPRFAVPAPAQVTLPVVNDASVFPVRRVYCVGRNYAAHAVEMGFTGREPPFFFLKPADAVVAVAAGTVGTVPYPLATADFQFEAELVVAIGRAGVRISADRALDHVFGYALGLDMTRRDLQMDMRKQGRPWEIGKAFDASAPTGPIHRAEDTGPLQSGRLTLTVDGQIRQDSDFSKLIWSVPEIIEHLSAYFELVPGDLIFTGTPEGVGPVHPGELMSVRNPTLGALEVRVTDPR
jgi:fumarylpyruvate hydrolase